MNMSDNIIFSSTGNYALVGGIDYAFSQAIAITGNDATKEDYTKVDDVALWQPSDKLYRYDIASTYGYNKRIVDNAVKILKMLGAKKSDISYHLPKGEFYPMIIESNKTCALIGVYRE